MMVHKPCHPKNLDPSGIVSDSSLTEVSVAEPLPDQSNTRLSIDNLYPLGACLCFLGAALSWSIQPIAARIILPIYGGSAAVWTSSLLFFQTGLLVGYTLAYGFHRLGKRFRWGWIFLTFWCLFQLVYGESQV